MITLNIAFDGNDQKDDKVIEFAFTGDETSKVAIEKGITHFLTFSGEANNWLFVTWKSETKSGTLFNPVINSGADQ